MEEDHYTVYCINLIHDRIDILDSSPDDHRLYHEVVGNRIIPRLNLLFQEATDGKFKSFTRFRRPILPVPLQRNATDSGFFAIKFMELWNGESFHLPILTVRPNIVLTLCCNVADLLHCKTRKMRQCIEISFSTTPSITKSTRLRSFLLD